MTLMERAAWDVTGSFDAHFAALKRARTDLGPERFREEALALACSQHGPERQVGLDAWVLVVEAEPGQVDDAVRLTAGLEADGDEDTRWSAAHLLAFTGDPRAADALCRFADDADGDVRWQVAFGLPAMIKHRPTDAAAAVDTLLALTDDPDDDVRDWATFGLGVSTDADSPRIREALHQRLANQGGESAGEALVDLARRRDPRVADVVVRRIAAGNIGNLVVMAAEELADPALCPALRRLQHEGWKDSRYPGLLDRALRACGCSPDAPSLQQVSVSSPG